MVPTDSLYVPGVCNIGGAEIRQRLRFGWNGLAVTVVLAAVFFLFHIPAPWRFILFLPATSGAVGFLQAAFHFCAAFGMRGVFNFGPEAGKTDAVEQTEFRRKDRAKAYQILGLSFLIGVAIALVGFFVR